MKKILLTSLVAALLPVALFAQSSPALPFVRIDRNPITSAMGGAEGTSALYNPAAVPFKGGDILASYQMWAPGGAKSSNINILGGIKIGKRIGINILGAYQSGQAYTTYDNTGKAGSEFVPSDLMAGAGFGFAITDFLSVGANVKYAKSTLTSTAGYGSVAGDLFVMFYKNGFGVTGGVASLGMPVKSGEQSYSLPASGKVAVSYDKAFGTSAIAVAADADVFFTGGLGMALGFQYAWNDMVFVRAGFHVGTTGAPLPTYASLGLGVKFIGIHLDASWITANDILGNTLNIGLGYAF